MELTRQEKDKAMEVYNGNVGKIPLDQAFTSAVAAVCEMRAASAVLSDQGLRKDFDKIEAILDANTSAQPISASWS